MLRTKKKKKAKHILYDKLESPPPSIFSDLKFEYERNAIFITAIRGIY